MSFPSLLLWFAGLILAFMGLNRVWEHKDRWINVASGLLFFALGIVTIYGALNP